MVKLYGPDFREKGFANAGGAFRLRDCFEECGLHDPREPIPGGGGQGLWGWSPASTLDELRRRESDVTQHDD